MEMEAPIYHTQYLGFKGKMSPNFFNISVTYRADSDIFYPYDEFVPLNGMDDEDRWSQQEVKFAIQYCSLNKFVKFIFRP
jgi:hypothetical protein